MVNGVQVAVGVFMQGDRILVNPHPGILLGEATNGRIVVSGPEIVVIQAAIKLFAGKKFFRRNFSAHRTFCQGYQGVKERFFQCKTL